MKSTADEYNESLREIINNILSTDSSFLAELGLGDAQIFDEYFKFFELEHCEKQSEFIKRLIIYIRDGNNKSFEETYLLKEFTVELLKHLDGETDA